MVRKSADLPVREAVPLPRQRRIDHRLSAAVVAELVQTYRDGAPTTELLQRYDLSKGSIIKLLHAHGVQMRRQGLSDADKTTAASLYRDGATLAQLGARFSVSPNVVRRALIAAGVMLRPRGGSKRK